MVVDSKERVLLVKHSYVAGWHLPGGGVDRGETALQAVQRELIEEAGIVCKSPPECVNGLFFNTLDFKNDHVVLFLVRDFHQDRSLVHAGEIVASEFFPVDNLPDGATPATCKRVEAYRSGNLPGFVW